MFEAHACLPLATDGRGGYGNTLGKFTSRVIEAVRADVLKIVRSQTTKPDARVYTIGDYGCADGAPSMDLIHDVIALVQERSSTRRPVQVLYEDQHSNDFNSLFRRLHGEIPDPPTYLHQFPDVFTMATATNFYQQCVPDNSLDLILNFIAVHWLSKKPFNMKNTIFCSFRTSPEEREAYSHQAAKDWETFLLHRAKELKPGGWLVLAVVVEDPDEPSSSIATRNHYLQAMEHVWQKYLESGRISREEFQRTSAGIFFRSTEDLRAPFLNPEFPVCQAGLHLEELRFQNFPYYYATELENNGNVGDGNLREAAVKNIMGICRPWSNSIILNGLDPERSNKKELVDAFFQEVQQFLLQTEPFSALTVDMPVAYVTIKKQRERMDRVSTALA